MINDERTGPMAIFGSCKSRGFSGLKVIHQQPLPALNVETLLSNIKD